MLVEDRTQGREGLRVVAVGVPPVRVAGHDPQRPLLTRAADDEWQPRLDRSRVIDRVIHLEPLAGERHTLPVKQAATDGGRLFEAIEALAERRIGEAEHAMVTLVPASPDPERGAPS